MDLLKNRTIAKVGGQDFDKLRDECVANGTLFEDPDFPATDASLQVAPLDQPVKWMRPSELCMDAGVKPEFFVNGLSRFGVKQGELGDAWSDNSVEWQSVPDDVKNDLQLNFKSDGEFWMSFKDWKKYYAHVEICNLTPDSLTEHQLKNGKMKWEMSEFHGEWKKDTTAGGCPKYTNTFCNNPQYVVTLTDPDDNHDDGLCTIIVALMEKDRRTRDANSYLAIGFYVYSVTNDNLKEKPMSKKFFAYNETVACSPKIYGREVSRRFRLEPGKYLIVPSTFYPNEEGRFLMRVFSEKSHNIDTHHCRKKMSFPKNLRMRMWCLLIPSKGKFSR